MRSSEWYLRFCSIHWSLVFVVSRKLTQVSCLFSVTALVSICFWAMVYSPKCSWLILQSYPQSCFCIPLSGLGINVSRLLHVMFRLRVKKFHVATLALDDHSRFTNLYTTNIWRVLLNVWRRPKSEKLYSERVIEYANQWITEINIISITTETFKSRIKVEVYRDFKESGILFLVETWINFFQQSFFRQ